MIHCIIVATHITFTLTPTKLRTNYFVQKHTRFLRSNFLAVASKCILIKVTGIHHKKTIKLFFLGSFFSFFTCISDYLQLNPTCYKLEEFSVKTNISFRLLEHIFPQNPTNMHSPLIAIIFMTLLEEIKRRSFEQQSCNNSAA